MLSRRLEFPLTHDIEELLEIAAQKGIALPPEISEVDSLTPYAVEARYPGDWGEISQPEVSEAIRLAEKTVHWARTTI